MKKRKYKIVNKKRFFISIFSISLIMLIVITPFLNIPKVYSSTYRQQYKIVTVRTGDTLWNIAKEHMPNNYDIRKAIYEIKQFNNMKTADIYPGDLVKIPIVNK